MKHGSKLVSLLLTLILVLAMAAPACAAGENTITVTGAQANETYNIYKMLDLSVNADKTAYTYTVNAAWKNFFEESGTGAAYVHIDEQGYVTWKDNSANMEAFAKAAAAFAAENKVSGAATAITPTADSNITFEGLDSGYYLITSTNGTLSMVATTPRQTDVTVAEKNPDSTITKKVQEDSTGNWGEANDAQIGDTINFRTTIVVKHGARNYVMHDKMDDGLSPDISSIAIEGLAKDTDYTVSENTGDDCTFEIHFKQTYLDKIEKDTTLTVTYTAILNEKADVTNGENNTARLTWGNTSTTEEDQTNTKTHRFSILKYAAEDQTKAPLAGAVFQLKDAQGNIVKLVKTSESGTEYRVANGEEVNAVDCFTTVSTEKITITGVDSDKYTLVEITAPAGYNKLSAPVEITVNADNALQVEVANNTGKELPSTGGVGTTLFYIAGAVLVLGAVVLLITRRRMSIKK